MLLYHSIMVVQSIPNVLLMWYCLIMVVQSIPNVFLMWYCLIMVLQSIPNVFLMWYCLIMVVHSISNVLFCLSSCGAFCLSWILSVGWFMVVWFFILFLMCS